MGFGWMFLGQLFFWTIKPESFDFLPDIFGYLLALYGIKIASKYCKNFKTAKFAASLGAVIGGALFAVQALMSFDVSIVPPAAASFLTAASVAIKIVYLMALLYGIYTLAVTTGADKTKKRSVFALILAPFLWLFYALCESAPYMFTFTPEFASDVLTYALLCEIVYVAISSIGVFSAYMWICVEGDENMEKKNNIRSPMDYFDKRREKDAKEKEENERRAAAEKAGKTVTQMYGVQKKKKKKR